ncbi:MAG: alpha/beta hydrolase [Verrucomicrobia bacterium]|nr:alpha/beta hydrolase [Verrucomicrobiota bacterium]
MSLSAGVIGAAALTVRYLGGSSPAKSHLPDALPPAIFATRLLRTSRGQVVYHESGQGEPLVFVHGIYVGASSYEWSKIYPRFAERWQVLAPDLIGFGDSERPMRAMTSADHVQALAEFFRAKCGGERAILVGSGLGAAFCAVLAEQHPELVRRLVLWMPCGGWQGNGVDKALVRLPWMGRVRAASQIFYRRHLATKAAIRRWLQTVACIDPAKISDETVEVLSQCATQLGAERAISHWFSRRFDVELERVLVGVTQPVALLWSEKAVFPPLEWAYRFQALPRHCSLTVVPEVGMLAALEDPTQMVNVLSEELDASLRVYRAERR